MREFNINNIESKYAPLALLGVPFNNTTLSSLVAECLNLIQQNKSLHRISCLSMIDGTLITKCYGWLPTTINHPEMLSILRHTDIPLISGKFLRGLAKSLGSTIAPDYTASAFFLSLCHKLGEYEKGVFILGENEKETKNAAIRLHDKFNRLRLVGIATPSLFVEGKDLINAQEMDELLVEQINSSNADVLLMNLSSAKQRIWLERVRHLLTIPLVITTENSLIDLWNLPSDSPPPAIKFHPKKNKKNSLIDFLKIVWITAPLITYHTLNRYLYEWFHVKNNIHITLKSQLFLSAHRSIAIVILPPCLSQENLAFLKQKLDDASSHDVLVLDFQKVHHIQPEGFYLLIKLYLQRSAQNKEIYGFSPTSDIRWLMKLHHTWDLFKNIICDSTEILLTRLNNKESALFFDTFTQQENFVTLSILGRLDHQIDYQSYMKKIIPVLGQANCHVDLSYCTYIDNSGFSFLLNLRKYLNSLHFNLILCSVNKELKKQFRNSSTEKLFSFK